MNRHLAALGVLALVTACATSAPAPAPEAATASTTEAGGAAEIPVSGAADAGDVAAGATVTGTSADTTPGMQMRMRMHAPDSARPGMGGMHDSRGMHDGRGMRQGRGMRRGMQTDTTPREVPPHLEEGQRIFQSVCAQCHSMDPPARLAPPMSHVARHLRDAFDTEQAALTHLKEYIRSPDAEKSIMPARAVERFGLMPAQPLPDEILDPVGRYVWYLGGG